VVIDETKENEVSLHLPLNSVLWFSKTGKARLYADLIVYPWDFLNSSQKILHEEVTGSKISESASIAKSSVIEGPCIIEDDTIIDDFCKIKGPTYIGKGSYICMGSLIRNCIFCQYTKIGFHCEVGKSYFAGNDKVSHQNAILDSIVGQHVWFGGYSGTVNVQLNRQDVKYRIGDTLVNTGAVVGNNCAIGASVIILPGRHASANSIIQAGTLLGKC
jgi:NDP-sugar pyrophosphorylase family protein